MLPSNWNTYDLSGRDWSYSAVRYTFRHMPFDDLFEHAWEIPSAHNGFSWADTDMDNITSEDSDFVLKVFLADKKSVSVSTASASATVSAASIIDIH